MKQKNRLLSLSCLVLAPFFLGVCIYVTSCSQKKPWSDIQTCDSLTINNAKQAENLKLVAESHLYTYSIQKFQSFSSYSAITGYRTDINEASYFASNQTYWEIICYIATIYRKGSTSITVNKPSPIDGSGNRIKWITANGTSTIFTSNFSSISIRGSLNLEISAGSPVDYIYNSSTNHYALEISDDISFTSFSLFGCHQ